VLLNSVVIVVREALEAALMISILLALSRILDVRVRWIAAALTLGALSAALYGYSLSEISDLFDGVGQEVSNAALQYLIFVLLMLCLFRLTRDRPGESATLPTVMAIAVMLAIAREGSEILVYLSGFLSSSDFLASVAIGSAIGAIIGISVGILFYYLLLALPPRRALPAAGILLILVGAGMCAQATRLLIQADWLSAGAPLWDTSGWLPEQSTFGQLLYALVGYEASPTAPEVITYLISIAVMALVFLAGRHLGHRHVGTAGL
jgi:high-affinity iron transporter